MCGSFKYTRIGVAKNESLEILKKEKLKEETLYDTIDKKRIRALRCNLAFK